MGHRWNTFLLDLANRVVCSPHLWMEQVAWCSFYLKKQSFKFHQWERKLNIFLHQVLASWTEDFLWT